MKINDEIIDNTSYQTPSFIKFAKKKYNPNMKIPNPNKVIERAKFIFKSISLSFKFKS